MSRLTLRIDPGDSPYQRVFVSGWLDGSTHAELDAALAPLLQLPLDLLAAVGLVAVFAGAANTPLACTLMAVELFGAALGVPAALGCATSYLCSGAQGIYHAQRPGASKAVKPAPPAA